MFSEVFVFKSKQHVLCLLLKYIGGTGKLFDINVSVIRVCVAILNLNSGSIPRYCNTQTISHPLPSSYIGKGLQFEESETDLPIASHRFIFVCQSLIEVEAQINVNICLKSFDTFLSASEVASLIEHRTPRCEKHVLNLNMVGACCRQQPAFSRTSQLNN